MLLLDATMSRPHRWLFVAQLYPGLREPLQGAVLPSSRVVREVLARLFSRRGCRSMAPNDSVLLGACREKAQPGVAEPAFVSGGLSPAMQMWSCRPGDPLFSDRLLGSVCKRRAERSRRFSWNSMRTAREPSETDFLPPSPPPQPCSNASIANPLARLRSARLLQTVPSASFH